MVLNPLRAIPPATARRALAGAALGLGIGLLAWPIRAQYDEPSKPAASAKPAQPGPAAKPGQPTGSAQPAPPPANKVEEARAIADRGYELYKQADYSAAADLFQQAEQISHSPAIVGFLGECYEKLGRLIEAATFYQQLADETLPEKPAAPEAVRKAINDAKAKLPLVRQRIPKLTIQVSGVPAAQVTVALDRRVINTADLGAPIPVDPGKHAIVITAAGHEPVTRVFEALERQGTAFTEAFTEITKEVPVPGPVRRAPAPSPANVVGPAVSYGVGITGVALGVVSGILYLNRASALKDSCPDGRCIGELEGEKKAASALGTTATVSFAVGAAGLVAGTLWLLLAPAPQEEGDAVQAAAIAPQLRVGLGALELRGRF